MLSIAHFLEYLDDQVGFQLALNGCSRMKPSREPFKSGNAGPWYATKTEYQRNRPHWKGSPEHLNCTHYLASESPISPDEPKISTTISSNCSRTISSVSLAA